MCNTLVSVELFTVKRVSDAAADAGVIVHLTVRMAKRLLFLGHKYYEWIVTA